MARVMVQTRVTVTVEVSAGTYGDDANFAFVRKQAEEEARNKVTNLLKGQGRVIGIPKVTAIVINECPPDPSARD
jgi:hypothetical protein